MLLVVFIIRCVPRRALLGAHGRGLPRRAHASMASRRSVVEQVYDRLTVGIAASAASAASHSGTFWSWTVGFSVRPNRRRLAAVDSSIDLATPAAQRPKMAKSSPRLNCAN